MQGVKWLSVIIIVLGGNLFCRMNKVLILILVLQFCAKVSFAQDSFHNPYTFSYYIDFTTEFKDSICIPEQTRIDVTYDKKSKVSYCTIMLNGEQMYKGRILDRKIESDNQTFLLDKYFVQKYNACLSIIRGSEIDNLKVAMIYYANQSEDREDDKTCYCLFLTDVERTKK